MQTSRRTHFEQIPIAVVRKMVEKPWQREIRASLNESDPKKLLEHVHASEAAIFDRLQELARNAVEDESDREERQDIADALRTLRVLTRDKLKFPDWKAK
jgi:hypothetical protein